MKHLPWLVILLAVSHAPAQPSESEHLPFALTISGGVSLGAYEAGLNWAVVTFLKRSEGLDPGRRPLRLVASTGASAGSINALLSAISTCAEAPKPAIESLLYKTWTGVGIEGLTRDWGGDDTLLSRAAFEQAVDGVRETLESGRFIDGCQVRVGLMVTRIKPATLTVGGVSVKNQRFFVPLDFTVEGGRAAFRNRPIDLEDPLAGNVIYMPTGPDGVVSVKQIVELMYASSAFPFAFGPRRLEYCMPWGPGISETWHGPSGSGPCGAIERQLMDEFPGLAKTGHPLDHQRHLVHEWIVQHLTHDFIDGGVFDNVPLGAARVLAEPRVLSDASPSQALEVQYVYLDPDRRRGPKPDGLVIRNGVSVEPPQVAARLGLEAQLDFISGTMKTATGYELQAVLRFASWNRALTPLISKALLAGGANSDAPHDCQRLAAVDSALAPDPAAQDCGVAAATGTQLVTLGETLSRHARPTFVCAAAPTPECSADSQLIAADLRWLIRVLNDVVAAHARRRGRLNVAELAVLRRKIASAALDVVEAERIHNPRPFLPRPVLYRLSKALADSGRDRYTDRRLHLTDRLTPLTASFIRNFGAFLEQRFGETDFFIGVYDGLFTIARVQCNLSAENAKLVDAKSRFACIGQRMGQAYQQLFPRQERRAAFHDLLVRLVALERLAAKVPGRAEDPDWGWLADAPEPGAYEAEGDRRVELNHIFSALTCDRIDNHGAFGPPPEACQCADADFDDERPAWCARACAEDLSGACLSDPSIEAFASALRRPETSFQATNEFSGALLVDGRSPLVRLALRLWPRQIALEHRQRAKERAVRQKELDQLQHAKEQEWDDYEPVDLLVPRTSFDSVRLLSLGELGLRTVFAWEAEAKPGEDTLWQWTPTTTPGFSAFDLLPYRVTADVWNSGLAVAYEPTLRGRNNAMKVLFTPMNYQRLGGHRLFGEVAPTYAYYTNAFWDFAGIGPSASWSYRGAERGDRLAFGAIAYIGLAAKLRLLVAHQFVRKPTFDADFERVAITDGWSIGLALVDLPGILFAATRSAD